MTGHVSHNKRGVEAIIEGIYFCEQEKNHPADAIFTLGNLKLFFLKKIIDFFRRLDGFQVVLDGFCFGAALLLHDLPQLPPLWKEKLGFQNFLCKDTVDGKNPKQPPGMVLKPCK